MTTPTQSSAAHTPVFARCCFDTQSLAIHIGDGAVIARVTRWDASEAHNKYGTLFAAAPAMLEALYSMVEAWEDPTSDSPWKRSKAIATIRSAIAQATGAQS